MSEQKFKLQNFETVEPAELLPRIKEFKAGGYRLVQACATKQVTGNIFVMYSFDLDHVLYNVKVNVPADMKLQSITGDYWAAFIYENEMHDLFGITFENLALDYGGRFFKVSKPTPWNPQD